MYLNDWRTCWPLSYCLTDLRYTAQGSHYCTLGLIRFHLFRSLIFIANCYSVLLPILLHWWAAVRLHYCHIMAYVDTADEPTGSDHHDQMRDFLEESKTRLAMLIILAVIIMGPNGPNRVELVRLCPYLGKTLQRVEAYRVQRHIISDRLFRSIRDDSGTKSGEQ